MQYIATTFGSTASLVCDRGYDGNGTINCLDTGSWETPPKCSIKDCGPPLNVTNGTLHYTATTFGSTASLVCDKGYDVNGTISCLDTGSWETPPNCIKECPEGWTGFENSCYLYERNKTTWENAKNDCESKDGYLVEITSTSENAFIHEQLNSVDYIWIGLNDIKTEGTFFWEYSGATFDSSKVGLRLYANNDIRDCIVYYASYERWDIKPCENTNKYICEIPL